MDFLEQMIRAGNLTKDIGELIIRAAENEDIEILPTLRGQLKEVIDVLTTISYVDRMMKAQNN